MIMPPNLSARIAAFFAGWTARIILALILIALMWWAASSFLSGQSAKVEVKLKDNQVEAALESGTDAVNTIGDQGGNEAAIDELTEGNRNEILGSDGAGALVDPDVRAAGLRSLCRRAAYKQRDECLQFAPAD